MIFFFFNSIRITQKREMKKQNKGNFEMKHFRNAETKHHNIQILNKTSAKDKFFIREYHILLLRISLLNCLSGKLYP